MDKIYNQLIKLLFAFYFIVPFIRDYKSLDLMATQWFYLSGLNTLVFVIIILKKQLRDTLFILFKNRYIQYFIIFILLCIPSFFIAQNITLTIVDFTRYIIVFSSILFCTTLLLHIKNFIKIVLFLSFLVFNLEVLELLLSVINNADLDTLLRSKFLKSLTGNINIAAFSLAIKLPLVYFFHESQKNTIFKFYITIVITLAIIFLLFIQSRASFIALSLFFILYFLYEIFVNKRKNKNTFILWGPILTGIIFFVVLNTNSQRNFTSRFTNIASDTSVNLRLRYWKGGIKQLIDNPLYGCGLGNWKIKSIEYDSNEIVGYTVPYHMHNDFLQIGAELGFFGMLFFISTFCFLLYYLNELSKNDKNKLTFFLFSCLLVYIVDAFFNFPHERAIIQSLFIIVASSIIAKYQTINENK